MRIFGWMVGAVAVTAATLVLTGCGKHEKPNFIYMPEMVYSPSFKAQKEGSMRVPPAGTVPRGYTPYPYPDDPELAGKMLKNPLPRSIAVMNRGKALFNTHCIVCHGPFGEGDGAVVPKFPRPPTLQSDKIKNYPDGRLFHIITRGQNLMPSYAAPLHDAEERWSVVHYLRALYRAKHPTESDRKAAKEW